MKTLITPLLGLFLCLFTMSSQAFDETCKNIALVYSNGMNTDRADADVELKDVGDFIKRHLQVKPDVLELAPNLTSTESKELSIRAYQEWTKDFPDSQLIDDVLREVFYQLNFNDIVKEYRNNNTQIGNDLESIEYQNVTLDADGFNRNDSLMHTANLYREYLDKDYCVIAVGFSQGNWVANWAYDNVIVHNPEYAKKLIVIGIGTPAYRVAGHKSYEEQSKFYVTTYEDQIVDIADLGFHVLPHNTDSNTNTNTVGSDFKIGPIDSLSEGYEELKSAFINIVIPWMAEAYKGHSLSHVYLTGDKTSPEIKRMIECSVMHFNLNQVNAASDVTSCKPYASLTSVTNAPALESVEGNTLKLEEDQTEVTIHGIFNSMSNQTIHSLEVKYDEQVLDLSTSGSYYTFNDHGEFSVVLKDIPEGSTTLTMTPLDADGNEMEVAPVELAQAVNGLLPMDDSTSVYLNIEREPQLLCKELDPWNTEYKAVVLESNFPYNYGLPANSPFNFEGELTFKITEGIPLGYEHCLDLNRMEQWNSNGNLNFKIVDLNNLTFSINFQLNTILWVHEEFIYREFISTALFFKHLSEENEIFGLFLEDTTNQLGHPVIAHMPLLYCDVVDAYRQNFDKYPSNSKVRLCYQSGKVYTYDSKELVQESKYDTTSGYLLREEFIRIRDGYQFKYKISVYEFISRDGSQITYRVETTNRDNHTTTQNTVTLTLGEH